MHNKRVRLACLSDSPKIMTGFGTVVHELYQGFHDAGYEVHAFGFMDHEPDFTHQLPYFFHPCNAFDELAHQTYSLFLKKVKPDIIFIMTDPGNLIHYAEGIVHDQKAAYLRNGREFIPPIVAYCPIEGLPLLDTFKYGFECVLQTGGKLVVYNETAKKNIAAMGWGEIADECQVVNHGCLSGDTLVLMPDMTQKTIIQVIKDKDEQVMGYTGDGKITSVKVLGWMTVPMMDKFTLKITLDSGNQIHCTRDHPILTDNGYIQAHSLQIGTLCGIVIDEQLYYNAQEFTDGWKEVDERARRIFETKFLKNVSVRIKKISQSWLERNKEQSMVARLAKSKLWNSLSTIYGLKFSGYGVGLFSGNYRGRRQLIDAKGQSQKRQICSISQHHYSQSESRFDALATAKNRNALQGRLCKMWLQLGIQSFRHWFQSLSNLDWNKTIFAFQASSSGFDNRILPDENGQKQQSPLLWQGIGNLQSGQGFERKEKCRVEWSRVAKIERDLCSEVYDLKTSSANFIANGIIVHNCDHAKFRKYDDEERKILRQLVGLDEFFVIGSGGVNKRTKGFPELIYTAKYMKDNGLADGVKFYCHTNAQMGTMMGYKLDEMARYYGVEDLFLWKQIVSSHYWSGMERNKSIEGILELAGKIPDSPEKRGMLFATLDFTSMLNCLDMYVDLSQNEGWGLIGGEAMMCGVPTLMVNDHDTRYETYSGGVHWIEPLPERLWGTLHTNARLVTVDPTEVAKNICMVKSSPELMSELSAKGQEVAGKYTWANSSLQMNKIIDDVAEFVFAEDIAYAD